MIGDLNTLLGIGICLVIGVIVGILMVRENER